MDVNVTLTRHEVTHVLACLYLVGKYDSLDKSGRSEVAATIRDKLQAAVSASTEEGETSDE